MPSRVLKNLTNLNWLFWIVVKKPSKMKDSILEEITQNSSKNTSFWQILAKMWLTKLKSKQTSQDLTYDG